MTHINFKFEKHYTTKTEYFSDNYWIIEKKQLL